MFIAFEGIDGSGKTTQARLLVDRLQSAGYDALLAHDPGTTPLGLHLRETLLHGCLPIGPMAEMLLFNAARSQMLVEIIRPALAARKIVVADRYVMSTICYQGHGGGLCLNDVREACRIATGGLEADLTFVFDLPVEKSLGRCKNSLDRIESRGVEFFDRLRKGYREEAKRALKLSRAGRIVGPLDATCRPESIAEFVWEQVESMLAEKASVATA